MKQEPRKKATSEGKANPRDGASGRFGVVRLWVKSRKEILILSFRSQVKVTGFYYLFSKVGLQID
jgi:hypothetical protein